MSSPDVIVAHDRRGDVTLPVNPFVSNRYHFGMLLGVADLETEQAYHRGKSWLHNAWLHGMGVVWGLGVEVRPARNEVVVVPGLAIDAHGRELSVAEEMCVDIGAWFTERRPEGLEVEELADGAVRFRVDLELCHDSCLERPVPSISEPCEEASFDTAYSRAVERGLPRLVVPQPAPPRAFRRLRQYFGQEPVDDDLVVAGRAALDAADPADRAAVCVEWMRRLAAADVVDRRPEDGAPNWSPVAGDGCVLLAALMVVLRPDGERWQVVVDDDTATVVDQLVRSAHIDTRTIQELLCPCAAADGNLPPAPEPEPDEGGPTP